MSDSGPDQNTEEIRSAEDLLPEVYAELRRLAATLSSHLQPGQTLQPTALVHKAYMRLVRQHDPGGEGRRHFFGAAVFATRPRLSRGSKAFPPCSWNSSTSTIRWRSASIR